jgi:hypothetical protein
MAEGNYLRKRRKSFFLSADCCQMVLDLVFKLGLSEGGVIEIAIREKYLKEIGPYPHATAPKLF